LLATLCRLVVEQTDGHRVGLHIAQYLDGQIDVRMTHPVAAEDQGHRSVRGQVIEGGAGLAPDLDHILKTRRRDQHHSRPGAFEQGVGCNGRPVEEVEVGCLDPG
jgi:hypothetical protein